MQYLTFKNRNGFDSLFDDFWSIPTNARQEASYAWSPATDIEEEEGHFLLTIESPGMKREDLNIEVNENRLVVSGERRQDSGKRREGELYSERRYGKFQRVFTLPSSADTAKIEASYEDGVLKIFVPKSEAAKPRQVKIGEREPGGVLSRLLGKKEEAAS